MASRREVIQAGVMASAMPASALATAAARAATPPLSIYKAVFDERYAAGRAYGARAAARGLAAAAIRGDVTDLWFHDLSCAGRRGRRRSPAHRPGVAVLPGATGAGRRHAGGAARTGAGDGLVSWLIAPTRRAPAVAA